LRDDRYDNPERQPGEVDPQRGAIEHPGVRHEQSGYVATVKDGPSVSPVFPFCIDALLRVDRERGRK
jgi:hypothetical protein